MTISMGIDIGSLFTKVVLMDDDKLVASRSVETTGKVAGEVEGIIAEVLAEAGIDRSGVGASAATGSGAEHAGKVDFIEDEVTCTAAAGAFLIPEINMIVHVGGQGIASILINEDGEVINFMRNDKCASGSGRCLQVLSHAVGIEIDDINEAASAAGQPVTISSQCGVFAESEVITLVNAGESPQNIVAGLCDFVAGIVAAQARKYESGDAWTLTGGVARIEAVVERVRERLGGSFYRFPYDPLLAAAIGAAVLAGLEEE